MPDCAGVKGSKPFSALAGVLTNATLPFALRLADHGLAALQENSHLRQGLNVHAGHITHEAVAKALQLDYVPAENALNPLMLSA